VSSQATLDEARSEYRDWLKTFGHKYRVTKEHHPKLLPIGQSPNPRRTLEIRNKYSLLIDYERIQKSGG